MDYSTAAAKCAGEHAQIVSIHNVMENGFVRGTEIQNLLDNEIF